MIVQGKEVDVYMDFIVKNKIISGIYLITCKKNNKKYIGQSINIRDRWKRHIRSLKNNNHRNDYMQKFWNKYGEKSFKFEIS